MAKKKFPSSASVLKRVTDEKALSKMIDDQLLSKGFSIAQVLMGPVGPRGPKGDSIVGPPGKNGLNGKRGSVWLKGSGAPTQMAQPGDKYLDVDTGDIYEFE